MKSACFVRKVDRLGRVVLPAELRHELNIAEQDTVEVQISGTSLVIQKYEQACVFCGSSQDILAYRNRSICQQCLHSLRALA